MKASDIKDLSIEDIKAKLEEEKTNYAFVEIGTGLKMNKAVYEHKK